MTGNRILIVEDEAITAMELEETLKKRGYDVIGTVSNGSKAVSIAKETWPDLIIMDIRIEGKIDGIEAANQINLFHDIPIIFLTAYSDDLTLSRAIKTKSHSFLLKPFNEKVLFSNIELAISKHRMFQKSLAFERIIDSMFDLMSDGIVVTDNQCTIHRVNANAEKLTGQKREDLIGKVLFDVFPFRSDQKSLVTNIIKTVRSGEGISPSDTHHVILKSPSSEETKIVTVKIEPLRVKGNEINEMIFIFSPIPG